jgi:hypothetical protein
MLDEKHAVATLNWGTVSAYFETETGLNII